MVFLVLNLTILGAAPRRGHDFKFPTEFLWGAATAAHQVEGNNINNDWYEWEQQGRSAEPSGIAADFYHRYEGDFDLAKSLAHNAFRMSIEWSRIEPENGKFSNTELLHYRDVLTAARARGLKTFVTLHHFTNPLWASRQGGWSNSEMPLWFGDYVNFIVPNLSDLVDFWITINEPNVSILTSYVVGLTPPGIQDMKKAAIALSNYLKAHARAYHAIHGFSPDAKVGFAHHMRIFTPERWWHPGDILVAHFVENFWNHQILRAMKSGHIRLSIPFVINYDEHWPELAGTLDFLGVNYYTRDYMKLDLSVKEKFVVVPHTDVPLNDLGWELYPKGLYRSLLLAGSYGVPIYITENGLADASDSQRKNFLCTHLRQLSYAMEDGVDVRGYLHWALIDNFEWVSGYKPRFGLIAIDYKTQERHIRSSARVYQDVISSGKLTACN